MMGALIRAAVYCRRSRGDDTKGVERQRADALAIARGRGWHVADEAVYVDNNISASEFSKKARVHYLRMLADIEAGKYDAVILWMEDRGHRQVIEAGEFVKLCLDHGVTQVVIESDDRTYDLTDPLARAEFYGKAAEAQRESAKTSRRVRRQRLDFAQQGLPQAGGTRHFGFQNWTVEEKGGIPVPGNAVSMRRVLQEQEWVREAVARILAGDSVRGIVADWNRRGIRTTKGGLWTRSSFRRMITSPTIAGYRQHNGDIVRQEDGTPLDAAWAPIVDRDDWESVRSILSDPSRRVTRGAGPKYLLAGIIWCGVCGQRMRAMISKSDQPCYRCVNFGPDAPAAKPSRRVVHVDREIERRLFYRIARSEQFKGAASRPDDDPTKPLYAELARLQGRLDRVGDDEITRLAEDEDLDAGTRKALLKAAERKRATIEQEMDALRTKLDAMNGERVRVRIPDNLPDVWPDLSLDRRRAIVASMIDFIVFLPANNNGRRDFDPDSVKVIWHGWKQWPADVPLIDPVRSRLEGSIF